MTLATLRALSVRELTELDQTAGLGQARMARRQEFMFS